MPLSRIQKKNKQNEYEEARAMFLMGIPLRAIGKTFGKSAEWARLVAKGGKAKHPINALKKHLDLTERGPSDEDIQPR